MKLFIDDLRSAPDESWTVARNYTQAMLYLIMYSAEITSISFDHDLGDRVPSGKDIANELIELDMDGLINISDIEITVHSANPPGAGNIAGLIDSYRRFKGEG